MKITFLGATRTVTGSKYLVEHHGFRALVDCGLFQGMKELRLRNREKFPVDPKTIDCVILTHAHIDHSGYLPLLVKNGFTGPIYCTRATFSLCEILLLDSAKIQEEEAEYANRRGFSKHRPALPLYTQQDVERCLLRFRPLEWGSDQVLAPEFTFRFLRAGHILGAAVVLIEANRKRLLFSGDLGRDADPLLLPPDTVERVDYLVLESTYGGRTHPQVDPLEELASIIKRTIERKGVVVIPAFSVGRTQTLLHSLYVLKKAGRIPKVPVFLNSPMSVNATHIFKQFSEELRLSEKQISEAFALAKYINGEAESKELNLLSGPMIIISASGMATGGRVLYHLRAFGPVENNTILFTGYQAEGTRGAQLIAGKREIKIHGELVTIRAEVQNLENFSAHADESEILAWLSHFKSPPSLTFLTHGEFSAAQALKTQIEKKTGWRCRIPEYLQQYALQ